MAYLPCFIGPHTHRGRNTNVYLGIARGMDIERRSGRVCTTHWGEIERSLAQFELDPDRGTLSDPAAEWLCFACLEPVDEIGYQVFVTAYPAKDERKDYWARVHMHCDLAAKVSAMAKPRPT